MKKNLNRLLSILLSIVMILSILPVSVFAEDASDTTGGSYDEGNWEASGTTSFTYYVDEKGNEVDKGTEGATPVTLAKTVTPVAGAKNQYDITLRVETSTTTTTQTDGGAVVLVIDTSSSMKSCAECGGRDSHKSGCKHYRSGYGSSNSVTTEQSRLYAAKEAAKSFLATYAGTDDTANRMLAIVTFDGDYGTKMQWANVAGGAGENSYNSAVSTIDGLGYATGTNMEGGLYEALGLLDDTLVNGLTKSVVLLSDGAPSVRMNNSNVNPEKADCDDAAKQATAIKSAGATLYTVCFGAANDTTYTGGPTVGNFLRDSVASTATEDTIFAYNADNTEELLDAFVAITESITSGLSGDGWTATDPMGDHFTVTSGTSEYFVAGADNTYTWELKNAKTETENGVTKYVYTYTYRVTFDTAFVGFSENQYYPTNKPTYLTIAEGKILAFPVPGTKGEMTLISVAVSKEWSDADNQDGKRPTSVTVKLLDGGEDTGKTVTLNADNNWESSFTGLPFNNEDGSVINYTVEEVAVPGYTAAITGSKADGYVITNSHTPEVTSFEVAKIWADNNNQDGIRPESITVNLLADGAVKETKAVTSADDWKVTFENYPVYKAGKVGEKIVYTVTEDAVEGYEASVNGLVITNTHKVAKTEVSVTKVWVDADNQDGIRPNDVTVKLFANGTETDKTLVLSEGNKWTGKFDNLDKNAAGKEIVYTVDEVEVAGYTKAITGTQADGYTITNTHTPEVITISGSKTWDDNNNQDGKRPESITIVLMQYGQDYKTKVVTADDDWAWTFENLPKNKNGKEIVYTILEEIDEETAKYYTVSYDGYNVTNTHAPEKTTVTVSKIWNDNGDQDGKRPESITVNLLANGTKVNEATLTEVGGWTFTFEKLDKYAGGKAIVYTITEEAVTDYTTSIDGYTITNTHEIEKVSVSGSKTWDDAENQDGKRPASITIRLLANGTEKEAKTVTAADGWKWTFTNLDKYANGEEINYTITEDAVEDYTTVINGYNVTNSYTPKQTSVTVTKSWQDNGDQDGIRPNIVTVKLLADGTDTGETLVLNEGNNWTGSFAGLDVYKAGKVIAYTVEEITVAGYNTVITGNQTEGYTITNSHTPATVEVSGAKTWDDNNNQDGARPESITINLLADGAKIDSKTVTGTNWTWSFENLPKYRDHGVEIVYTITEAAVEDYTTVINGYNVTNTHAPEKTSVTVTKAWLDNNDQDGIQPKDVTVNLLANGTETGKTLVLNSGNKWTGSFADLDKYSEGEEIAYTVAEVEVEGYTSVITGSQQNGYTITNTHTPETVVVSGSKTWKDNSDQDGARPDSITIRLKANGKEVASKTVTAANGWTWTFENLPKYENHGSKIEYTITEDVVDDYTSAVNGYNVTNTHAPEKTSVTVTKSWADNNDQDGIRPNSITVKLLANGKDSGKTLVLNSGNRWTGSFADLDKYEGGKVVAYTVAEVEVEGYASVITGNQQTGYTITNSHNPAVVVVSGSKTWIDNNNQDGKRPVSITINLLKNGKVIDTKVVTAEEDWAWSFTNLPKFENHGTLITYSIAENVVDEYTTAINGYNVTNTHTPEKTSVTVSKGWEDNNDQDGIRPNDITVVLVANGEATKSTLVLNEGNNWTDSFTDLDKYEGGEVVTYTVAEVEVEGYTSVITGSHAEGYTITNSHTPAVVAVEGSKTWVDADNQDGFRPESITINLLADGEVIDTVEVTEADGWAWSFTNLPKYKDHGTEIVYGVTEVAVDEYVTEYDGYNVINTHAPEKVSVTVSKAWEDNNDQDGIRPDEVTVILLTNGEASDKTLALTAEDNWIGSFTDLDKYENGVEIVYTVAELKVDGYDTVITGDQKVGYTITNSHEPEKTVVAGKKTWDDANNQDGKRPEVIEINVFGNGVLLETVKVTEAEGWAWTFDNLPKYVNGGQEVAYAITENAVEGYTATYEGYNVTNSYTPEETGFSVSKVWADSDDADGIRPDEVEIKLFANGEDTGIVLVLSEETKWVGSINGLPKYWEGEEIEYTVEEVAVKGYNTVIKGTVEEGFTVTNSHVVIPDTGDNRNPVMWISLMAGAVLTAGIALFSKKRKTAK